LRAANWCFHAVMNHGVVTGQVRYNIDGRNRYEPAIRPGMPSSGGAVGINCHHAAACWPLAPAIT
jgi:hypothetical protein